MNLTLDERAVTAKKNEAEFERLLLEYRPFILGCVYNNGFGQDEDDISIALTSFYFAVQSYQRNKGSFLAYAGTVIRCRLIDQKRKTLKYAKNTISGEDADIQIENYIYRQQIDTVKSQQESRLEIAAFIDELNGWGIQIEDLSAATPRHKKTKRLCSQAISILLNTPALHDYVQSKKKLPIHDLAQKLGVKPKILENHRRYLIAAFVIHSGDYIYLKEYVPYNIFGKEATP